MANKLEQRGNGDDLVGLVADLGLPEHHALARGEGRDDMDGLFGPLLLVGAPHRLAVDGDHLGRRLRQRRRPRHKTALERHRVKPGEDDAQLVVRGRAVGEGSKAPQERQLGPAEARDVGHRLRPRQRRRQHQEQHLVERIGDLALLPVVRQVLEMRQENSRLLHRPSSRVPFRHRPILQANQRITTDSASRTVCHAKFQSIALRSTLPRYCQDGLNRHRQRRRSKTRRRRFDRIARRNSLAGRARHS